MTNSSRLTIIESTLSDCYQEIDKIKTKEMDRQFKVPLYRYIYTLYINALITSLKSTLYFIKLLFNIIELFKSSIYIILCIFLLCFKKKKKALPRSSSGFLNSSSPTKLTMILDLDRTLVYSTTTADNKPSFIIENKSIYKRPYLDTFLSSVGQCCDLVVYTSALKDYADKVIDQIDKNKIIKHRYYRHDCISVYNYWCKDATSLGYDKSNVIILDDQPECYINCRGIYIFNYIRKYYSD